MARAPTSCPRPEALARLAAGTSPPEERARLTAHAADCPLCRAIAHGLGGRPFEASGPASPTPAPPTPAPPAPSQVGPRSLWWVPWVTHALLALAVGLAGWWFLGR